LFGNWAHFLLLGVATIIGLVGFRMSSNLLYLVGQSNKLTRYGVVPAEANPGVMLWKP